MATIYRNQRGKDTLLRSYERYLSLLPVHVKRTYVKTRFGTTHVLESGSPEAKPIIVLQGGNCINPMTLNWFAPLLERYHIIAPDTRTRSIRSVRFKWCITKVLVNK
ncbi:hypothetical protein [Paenibacillus xanthanilyticus]|uniref:Alpha/beta hydrolase n=1 Tax=Paenibacillus xanthanilyticus TaxID=1783531 RepID=A0ABV8K6R0_9BACL